MPKILFKTIGELKRSDGILVIKCTECRHIAVKSSLEFALPDFRDIDSLRFKCSSCGFRRTYATPYIPITEKAISNAVNGEFTFEGYSQMIL